VHQDFLDGESLDLREQGRVSIVGSAFMDQQKKFYVALAIYAVLGILIWMTIDDIPVPLPQAVSGWVHITLRQVTLIVVGMFALRTTLHWNAERIRAEREREEEQGEAVSGR
jgi:hypothetical protein